MSQVLVLASQNKGKLSEISSFLSSLNYEIKLMSHFGMEREINETGDTFEKNALIKAKEVAKHTGIMSLADDSGLMIDALFGEPGVFSRRIGKTDSQRIDTVLGRMEGIVDKDRTARFVSVVCLYNPTNETHEFFEGVVEGMIADKPLGTNGFGYDPIFYSPELGKSFGQASFQEKSRVSHRARALEKLIQFLRVR